MQPLVQPMVTASAKGLRPQCARSVWEFHVAGAERARGKAGGEEGRRWQGQVAQGLGGLSGGVELRSCLHFADEETEAWSHQVAGGKVRRSPAGLALMTRCSCHLKAEG